MLGVYRAEAPLRISKISIHVRRIVWKTGKDDELSPLLTRRRTTTFHFDRARFGASG